MTQEALTLSMLRSAGKHGIHTLFSPANTVQFEAQSAPARLTPPGAWPTRLERADMAEDTAKLCECGCGEQPPLGTTTRRDRGTVRGKPLRFVPGHQNRKSPHEYLPDANGCWIWQRGITKQGYGSFAGTTAHRVYYERFKGPIPEGLVVDHLCSTPACVNPDHLEAVPQYVNAHRGRKTILTPAQVRDIRASEMGCRRLARKYGVARGTIMHIRSGRRWKDTEA